MRIPTRHPPERPAGLLAAPALPHDVVAAGHKDMISMAPQEASDQALDRLCHSSTRRWLSHQVAVDLGHRERVIEQVAVRDRFHHAVLERRKLCRLSGHVCLAPMTIHTLLGLGSPLIRHLQACRLVGLYGSIDHSLRRETLACPSRCGAAHAAAPDRVG